MPIMIKGDSAVLFVHVPKCGGSSFEKQMSERGWRELYSIRGVHSRQLTFMRCSPQHMHAALIKQVMRPQLFDKIIMLIREPLARLRSEYAWQQTQGITQMGPKAWIDHAFSAYQADPFAFDNHIRPQHEFLIENALIFKLEEDGVNHALDTASPQEVKRDFRRPFFLRKETIPHQKKTHQTPEVCDVFNREKQQIVEFYREDYELFGYPNPLCPD